MTDVDALGSLVDDLRGELHAVVDELERSREAHRQVESLLLAVLEHVPVPVVIVDREERVRATSAAADEAWEAKLDAPLAGVAALRDLAPVARVALEEGGVSPRSVPAGFGAAVLDEPGTDERYVVLWSTLADRAAG